MSDNRLCLQCGARPRKPCKQCGNDTVYCKKCQYEQHKCDQPPPLIIEQRQDPDVRELALELKRAYSSVEELRDQNQELVSDLFMARRDSVNAKFDLADAEDTFKGVEAMEKRIEDLEEENNKLREDLQTYAEASKRWKDSDEEDNAIIQIRMAEEIATLKKELEQLTAEKNAQPSLAEKIEQEKTKTPKKRGRPKKKTAAK